MSTNENINFAEVNLAASPELAKRINVRFYPSFLFFNKHGSQPVQFDGKFTKGALLKFIDENMGDELKSNYRDNADGFPEDSETSLQGMSRQIKDLLALQLSPSFLNISEVAEEIFKVIQSLPQNLYTAYAQLLTVWLQYGSKSLSAAYSEIRDGIRCLSLSPHERRSLEESAALMISFADTFNVDLNKTVGEPAGFVEKTGYMCHADDCEKIKSLFGERGAAGKSRDSIILRLITEGIVRNDSNLFSTVSTCVNTASGLMNFVQGGSMERNQDGGLTVKQGKSSKVRMESSSVGDSLKISGSSYQSSLLTSILIQIPKVVLYLMSWAPGAISALLQVFLSGGKACKAFPNGYNKSMDLTPEAIEKAFSLQTIGIQPANIPSRSHVPVVGVPNGQILATAKPLREDGSCVVALNKISSATEAMAVNLVAKITEALSEDLVASLVWDLFLNWFRKEFPSFFSSLSQEYCLNGANS